jgi:hypothetical protein
LKPSGISEIAAPSALKRICNNPLWLHALRLESAAISKIAQVGLTKEPLESLLGICLSFSHVILGLSITIHSYPAEHFR